MDRRSEAHEADAAEAPLRVEGFTGTPEEIERQWYEKVYLGRGDRTAQLTLRAVLMGAVIGGILSLSNLYIGLKAGWGIGVTITACITSYAVWSLALKLRLARTRMTILENNCMQSTAGSAGYSTGSVLVSAFSAYFMINHRALPLGLTLAWVGLLGTLGVTMAIPMKRQLINVEQLRFPTGIATAETLRALYSRGRQAAQSARALGIAGAIAALFNFWSNGFAILGSRLAPFGLDALTIRLSTALLGPQWTGRTIVLILDPIFIGAGGLMGARTAVSMLLGATLAWGVFVPILQAHHLVDGGGYRNLVSWTLWGGVSCMVASGLLGFALGWRALGRAFRGLGAARGRARTPPSGQDRIEAPLSWFFAGQAGCLVLLCWLAKVSLKLPVWETIVAVLLSFVLALVACRVTGETDTTPTGPFGKITQLIFGALNPGNLNINLMSASITSAAAISSANLLTDLKSGHLLGANPRRQFLAQLAGVYVGTVTTVFAYRIMVPTASVLGSDQFPAPAAQTWRLVALTLSQGFGALHPVQVWSIVIGAAVGAILTLLPRWFPRGARWMPSPAGIGLSWTFHWYFSLLFCLGGLAGLLMERNAPEKAKLFNYPVAAGLIAGGSLMGVLLIFIQNVPIVYRQLFH